ncbi:hypothetical protein [Propionimicrobium sp. PCR01-08-3]|uniref:hypothetical protein n=1 Tax=Propionimicrobium sp. PCR01-08-3 TaxID=3052086 RepID=UPI00255C3E1E|nr:hypothetical protein [Propionimicrobium sp. PCR01-08-3]WIY82379.1 hypothetical protein QQ658_12870 [Propionimicrobium sp. PCR01-08-3]
MNEVTVPQAATEICSDGGRAEFAHPGPFNAPACYWFWHRVPSPDEITTQVATMRRAGYQSFQIQTRLSFPLDQYLSDDYLAACRLAAEQARRQNMIVGIYDEYNWLSGHAGGRVVAGHDDLRERHLFHVTAPVDHGHASAQISGIVPVDVSYLLEPGMNWVFEGGEPKWDEWTLIAAVLHDQPTGLRPGPSCTDVTGSVIDVEGHADGCVLGADLRGEHLGDGSRVTFFVAARCATSRMINYLMPAAAERFTEVGLSPYARAFDGYLGSTVRYVFFDQPHACFFTWDQNCGTTASTLMYEEGFYSALREAAGGDWMPMLLSLAEDTGERSAILRARFFEEYASCGIDAFFGTLSRWCHEHDLLLTGHEVLGHVSTWDPTGTVITDDPRTNFGVDYFGIDSWRDITAADARNDYPQLSAKFGDSVARAHGRSGCIIEQYFGRVVPGSHFAAGWWELTLKQLRAQTMRHHILGMRQLLMHAFWLTDGFDGEQMFSNPRFDFAPGINFEPWFGYHRSFADESARVSVFCDGMTALSEVAVLYPLATAQAHGPGHEFGKHTAFWTEHLARAGFDYHLVDERELLGAKATVDRLRLPHGRNYSVIVLPAAQTLYDSRVIDVLEAYQASGGRVLSTGALPSELTHRGRAVQTSWAPRIRWDEIPDWQLARAAVLEGLPTHVWVEDESPDSGQLWVRRGRHADVFRVMAFNDSDTRKPVVLHTGRAFGQVRFWNADDGTISDWQRVEGDIRLVLDPGQVLLIEVEPGGDTLPRTRTLAEGWTISFAGGMSSPIEVIRGWETQGFATISGFGSYRHTFVLSDEDTAFDWQLDLPVVHGSATVEVNGEPAGELPWAPGRVTIARRLLASGDNHLTVTVASSAANHYYAGTRLQGVGLASCGLGSVPLLRPVLPVTELRHSVR